MRYYRSATYAHARATNLDDNGNTTHTHGTTTCTDVRVTTHSYIYTYDRPATYNHTRIDIDTTAARYHHIIYTSDSKTTL